MRSCWLSIPVLLCAGLIASAQAPTKVGVLSIQGAIIGTKDGQKASQQLDAQFVPKQKEFDTRQNEIAQMEEQLNKGGAVMADDKRTQLGREVDEKKKRLERDMQDAEEALRAQQQAILSKLSEKMLAIIEKFAKDNGYYLILDVGEQSTPILYASSNIDITQDIISLYDRNTASPAITSAPKTPPAAPGTLK